MQNGPDAADNTPMTRLARRPAGHPHHQSKTWDGVGSMGRQAWPVRPLPDGRGDVWRWRLGSVAELPAARAGLRDELDAVGFPRDDDDTSTEQLVLAFDELASNALRHGEHPVVATGVAGSGGWRL